MAVRVESGLSKKIASWALFDWANSVFSTTVMAGFFPLFFKSYWNAGVDPVVSTSRLGLTISLSSVAIAMLSPFLGALADLRGLKKSFSIFFIILGVLSTLVLAFLGQESWLLALIAFGLGMMSLNASTVFNDSLLPSVAPPEKYDFVSSLGYSLGYLGGGILFLVNVLMYLNPHWFGLNNGIQAIQFSFLTVGVWWFLFSLPMIFYVPEPKTKELSISFSESLLKGLRQNKQTFIEILNTRNLKFFLFGYWLYIDGVYTIMTMAVDFAMSIGLESKDLITALLLTQFIGFPFALLFGYLSKKFGCRYLILICIGVYIFAVLGATGMTHAWHFYVLAAVIGMVQGGVQSLSRSFFGKMIPLEKSGEYFGLFNLVGKFASILGPATVSFGVLLTGNPRMGLLGLILLFVVGGLLLSRVPEVRTQPARP